MTECELKTTPLLFATTSDLVLLCRRGNKVVQSSRNHVELCKLREYYLFSLATTLALLN